MSYTATQFVRSDVSINAATGVETFPASGAVPVADGAGGAAWVTQIAQQFGYKFDAAEAVSLYSNADITFAWDPAVGQVTFHRTVATSNAAVGRYTAAAGAVMYKSRVVGAGGGALYLSSLTTIADADFNPAISVNTLVWNEFVLTQPDAAAGVVYTVTVEAFPRANIPKYATVVIKAVAAIAVAAPP
jgi:hypothetical protein